MEFQRGHGSYLSLLNSFNKDLGKNKINRKSLLRVFSDGINLDIAVNKEQNRILTWSSLDCLVSWVQANNWDQECHYKSWEEKELKLTIQTEG